MIPSKIKIECFAKRCHMGTLGGKGLRNGLSKGEEDLVRLIRDEAWINILIARRFMVRRLLFLFLPRNELKVQTVR